MLSFSCVVVSEKIDNIEHLPALALRVSSQTNADIIASRSPDADQFHVTMPKKTP